MQFPAGSEPTIDGDCSDWNMIPEEYFVFTEDLFPLESGSSSSDRHARSGLGRGDYDPNSFQTVYRVGWSAETGELTTVTPCPTTSTSLTARTPTGGTRTTRLSTTTRHATSPGRR